MVAVARISLLSDAAEEESVVSFPQYEEMGHGGAPRDTPYSMVSITSTLSKSKLYVEPKRAGLILHGLNTPSETQGGQQHLPVDVSRRVIVLVHGFLRVHKLGG